MVNNYRNKILKNDELNKALDLVAKADITLWRHLYRDLRRDDNTMSESNKWLSMATKRPDIRVIYSLVPTNRGTTVPGFVALIPYDASMSNESLREMSTRFGVCFKTVQ